MRNPAGKRFLLPALILLMTALPAWAQELSATVLSATTHETLPWYHDELGLVTVRPDDGWQYLMVTIQVTATFDASATDTEYFSPRDVALILGDGTRIAPCGSLGCDQSYWPGPGLNMHFRPTQPPTPVVDVDGLVFVIPADVDARAQATLHLDDLPPLPITIGSGQTAPALASLCHGSIGQVTRVRDVEAWLVRGEQRLTVRVDRPSDTLLVIPTILTFTRSNALPDLHGHRSTSGMSVQYHKGMFRVTTPDGSPLPIIGEGSGVPSHPLSFRRGSMVFHGTNRVPARILNFFIVSASAEVTQVDVWYADLHLGTAVVTDPPASAP